MTTERQQAEEFVSELEEQLQGRLVSAVIYGSAARGEYRPGASDINLLAILSKLDAGVLRAVAGPTRGWLGNGNPPPLLMSEAEWRSSADVFPIEYSDIRDAHVRVAGSDPFEGIRIDRKHLRLQLEHELRSNKIQLREGLIVAGDAEEEVAALLVRSLSTFFALFRGLLRLSGDPVPAGTDELVEAVAAKVGFSAAPVLTVLAAKQAGREAGIAIGGETAAGYLDVVERTARWLDEYVPAEGEAPEV
ncbi:MAG TPA: nucleotidyltransferase domain-containing protein [Longimicrobiaceae bacterium]|nr:nucleotidyltransferase domain-containing protein [Longimicrobiaceae bacterium]